VPTPNERLRAAREAVPSGRMPGAGCSRDELAERVTEWLAQRDPKSRRYAMDGNHIGKLERGAVSRPAPHYRAALRAVLGATDAELGFAPLLDPEAAERVARVAADPRRVDAATVEALAAVLASVRRLEDETSAATVVPTIEQQLPLVRALARQARYRQRQAVAALAAELCTYRGWLAIDSEDYAGAQRVLHDALALSVEAGSQALMTEALGFDGYRELLAGNPAASASIRRGASAQARTPVERAVAGLHEARTLAIAGERTLGNAALRTADAAISQCDAAAVDDWHYYCTTPFLIAQRGLVHYYAGRYTDAGRDLAEGLDAMPAEHRGAEWARQLRDTLAAAA
jgi:hypothetical protein